jgi:UDP-2,3-diacylglucosamine pyrophosphatase LpxH
MLCVERSHCAVLGLLLLSTQVDRVHTPWVINAPWYHTYAGHYKEVECMRQAYEPLLVKHQVDLVVSGHVHAYERTRPVVNYQVGATHGSVECGGLEGRCLMFAGLVVSGHVHAFECTRPVVNYQVGRCWVFVGRGLADVA